MIWIIIKSAVLYIIIAVILGLIPVNSDFKPEPGGTTIYIVSNGIHTDIVLPVYTPGYSWQEFFKHTGFNNKIQYADYLAFGWGNKLFYLNTPEWKDLTPAIAVKALFIKSEPAMHVTLLEDVRPGKNVRRVKISEMELRKLTAYIFSSFSLNNDGNPVQIPSGGYGPDDLFFNAHGKFSIVKPCNEWTNEGLKSAGIRCVVWSPFDKPLLRALSNAANN